jgi:purine-binding chemotaxis protein CheW
VSHFIRLRSDCVDIARIALRRSRFLVSSRRAAPFCPLSAPSTLLNEHPTVPDPAFLEPSPMADTQVAAPALIDTSTSRLHLLVFELDEIRVAIPSATVVEVVRAVAIAPLPQAPSIVEGVINARGTLVPVFDLRRRLGLPARALAPHQHLVLARSGPRPAALRVDRAVDLVTVAEQDIESAERLARGTGPLTAVARLPDGLLVICELEQFLSPVEAEQVDAALVASRSRPGPATNPIYHA